MEWQGGNKQRPNYWQWRRSFILGDSNWKFFQVGYPVDMYLSPNWMLSRMRSVKLLFFRNALSRAHRGVLVPTSLWLGPIDSLPFATVVFWLHSSSFLKEKRRKKTPLSTFHCNQLQHTRSACFKTDLPDYFRFNFVQVVTEPCGSVVLSWRHEVTWPKHGIFSCRRRSCSKRRVCFHSNQYFYVPQENVNLSNEQRVC